ncbi:hypothetical protein ACE6H2_006190 [Prunus campanulata]
MEEICISIASKMVEEPVALIGRQLNYLIYYDSNIESLTDALKKLDDKKNDVQRFVDAAKRNGATIKDQVQSWLEDVSKVFREAQELQTKVNMQRRCLYGLCPSLKSRYSLSRKAKKIAQHVLDLKLDEGLSNNVANPAPLQQLGSIISSEDECKGLPIAIITVGKALLSSGGGGWLGVQKVTNQEHCRAISLVDVKLDENYADGLECPKLELLQLKNSSGSSEYSNHFKRLRELNVLSFLGMDMSATGSKDEMSMASLDEVRSLSNHLNVVAIKIPDVQMLRNDEFLLKSQPIRFHVSINISWSYKKDSFKNQMRGYLFENSLMLCGDVKEYLEIGAVRYFLKQSEDLSLHHTFNLKYVIEELDGQGGFQHLKVLSIDYDNDIEYLMNGTNWTRHGQPAFPILKSVTFKNVYKLKVVCRGNLLDKHSFKNLRSIEIGSCDELKYVFSLSVAQNLVQLQSLTAENCAKVEEIISKERMEDDNASHMITFPRLTVLKLFLLPMLYGFYTGNPRDSTYEIIKPNDESVNKMKETRNVNQVAGSTSSKSKVAQVGASCNALFPSNCISWLPNLEQLQVWFLSREQRSKENSEPKELVGESLTSEQGSKENNEPVLNVVFDLEGHDSAFSQLQKLDAVDLIGVEHLWKNVEPGFQGFQNVRSLTIEGCGSLKYLCPYEIYKLLVNLQEVGIVECENMETIVLAAASTEDNIHEEGKETSGSGAMTLFPKLINSFTLLDLPNLDRFCPDAYSFAWSSSTRAMQVIECPKLKTLGFAPVSKKLPATTAENLSDDHVRGREESESGCASSTGSGFGFGCAPLVCLQSRPSTRNFTQILPRPVNREVTSTNLQTSPASNNLEVLYVRQCDLLEVIFLVQETPSTQAFDKLRELSLWNLRMLSHIWEKGLQVSSGFGNLRSLDVWGCSNLRYLFSLHIAKLLTCLETIYVFNCRAMEKIVGEVEGGGESIEDELTFPHVNSIELWYLPKLESFCSQAYTLNWPALEKVKVQECPELTAFAHESLYV